MHEATWARKSPQRLRALSLWFYSSLKIFKNRFTVRERSKRRQQSAISVLSAGEINE